MRGGPVSDYYCRPIFGKLRRSSTGKNIYVIFAGPTSRNAGSAYSQFYTPDRTRYKQVANYSGTLETTIYIGGLLEKMTRGALTEYRHTIPAGEEHTVLYTRRSNGTIDTYHVTRDHLGSASAITNSAGTVLVNESFTAFGERRGANWSGTPSSGDLTQIAATTRRGFTDHEHLDNLSLIHMNGRVYDPALGRFISADPYIDGWTHTQGYNRYSYVKNNPLRAVDPTGFKKTDESDESEGPGGPIDNITVYGQQSGGNGTVNLLFVQMSGSDTGSGSEGGTIDEIVVTAKRPGPNGGNSSGNNWGYWLSNGINAVSFAVGSGELSNVRDGQWLGKNGKWNPLNWGGNQHTGSRSSVLDAANRFKVAGRIALGGGLVVSGVEAKSAYDNNDPYGMANAGIDAVMGVVGTFGGLPGLITSGSYFLIDATIGMDTFSAPVTDRLCAGTGNC